jgi:hypothetical protein
MASSTLDDLAAINDHLFFRLVTSLFMTLRKGGIVARQTGLSTLDFMMSRIGITTLGLHSQYQHCHTDSYVSPGVLPGAH